MNRTKMNVVIVGHVDHGKSTVIGRLLAETNSLPEGKLEQVKAMCAKNAKPFEYAFLLDALKDEQAQGITIDTARCFFKTDKRDYIILDAPGHIEFLKNMVTGASRAEAALLVIDAHEGIKENSKRHGHMLSMLGIRQVSILVNKMDLVDYSEEVFNQVKKDFTAFLKNLNVTPESFIPISAMEGDNIVTQSPKTSWYQGSSVLNQMDLFKIQPSLIERDFRLPIQDIYKFTKSKDDRRIFAGTIETGKISVGDRVLFLPSQKQSTIQSIESFNTTEKKEAVAGEATGVTLETQIYIKPGEMMVREDQKKSQVSARFKANIFWVGKAPMIMNKVYKLKLASSRMPVKLVAIKSILDTSDLSTINNKLQIDRHDVSECILETSKPLAFDLASEIENTSRFVIVDNYEISGGGIILQSLDDNENSLKDHIKERSSIWETSSIKAEERIAAYNHKSKFIVVTGNTKSNKEDIAKHLERRLFNNNFKAYYLGISSIKHGLDADLAHNSDTNDEYIRRLGELAHIMTDSGQIFITTISNTDEYDIEKLKLLNEPHDILIIKVGDENQNNFDANLTIESDADTEDAVNQVYTLLIQKEIILEYYL